MEQELQTEVLSVADRRKKGRVMKRYAKKIANARKRKQKRRGTKEVMNKRARKKAINQVRDMVTGNKKYKDMTAAEKSMVDRKVARRSNIVDIVTRKMKPKVRKIERARMSGRRVNEEFEMMLEASETDVNPRKKYHQMMTKDGKVKIDKRFKIYKPKKEMQHEESELDMRHQSQDKRLDARQDREKKRAKIRSLKSKINDIRTESTLSIIDEVYSELEDNVKSDKIVAKLSERAEVAGFLYAIIEEVYDRGINAWNEYETLFPEQYAMNRVNSFINEGFAYELDSDLLAENVMLDKALKAIETMINDGVALNDAVWQVSQARGVNMRPKELALAYSKTIENPTSKKIQDLTTMGVRLRKKYGFAAESKLSTEEDLVEEGGAGEWGTPELTKKLCSDTPGQTYLKYKKKRKTVTEEKKSCSMITKDHMKSFERFVDRMFKKYDMDFDFTKHFNERMSDSRNDPCIKLEELAAVIKKIYAKQGRPLKGMKGSEAVVKDLQSDLNIPIVIKYDERNDEFDVVMKTIMRKKNFRTPDKIIKY